MNWVRLVLSICFYMVVKDGWAFDLANVRMPANTDSVWVGKGIDHNGVKMDIMALSSHQSSDQLITFYRNLWESEGGQGESYTLNEAGGYKVISKLEGNHNIVVQVRDGSKGDAEGFLSAIDITSLGRADSSDEFPALSNTLLISKTLSNDTGKSAVTRVMVNNYSVSSNVEFYRQRFEVDGWKRSFVNEKGNSYMALYSRNNMTMEIAISKNPGRETVIFVNVVDES